METDCKVKTLTGQNRLSTSEAPWTLQTVRDSDGVLHGRIANPEIGLTIMNFTEEEAKELFDPFSQMRDNAILMASAPQLRDFIQRVADGQSTDLEKEAQELLETLGVTA